MATSNRSTATVIVTLAARMVMNPQSLRSSSFEVSGDYSEQWTAAQPVGLTLPEQLVLARYRKRTA